MTDQIDLHLGKAIRRRRRLIGLTQTQVAERLGLGFQQIQKYECAANKISAAQLWRIADVLECDVASFFFGLQTTYRENRDPIEAVYMGAPA